ncbi:MAG: IS1634 family transposase [Nitrospira sp.]
MYVEFVPNRNSPPAVLLREAFREGTKVRKRTLANLSHWPPERIELLRHVLKGETLIHPSAQLQVTRSLPHGAVAAVLELIRQLGLDTLLDAQPSRWRQLTLAMLVARVVEPSSKLATSRALNPQTAHSTIGELLDVGSADEDDLYAALDWLGQRQAAIEQGLAQTHLADGSFVLYDLSSTYFEGRHCPLARLGHSRDERRSNLQITFGLLTNSEGCPVAVEVFEGYTGDPKTVAAQIDKLKNRFRLKRVVIVGDRGMLTQARIREDLRPAGGISWITALRAPEIQKLAAGGVLQLSLFDHQDLGEIQHPDYPDERLIACRNPLLADERKRKREELLLATEKELERIAVATRRARRRLRGRKEIGLAVGKVLGRFKVGKHFRLEIEDDGFRYYRNQAAIEREAALDGIYILRTNVPASALSADDTVRRYKSLAQVERAFRSLKSVDLKVRPIHHHLAGRVQAHVFLCMLAYYVEWHMRRKLAPVLFDDTDPEAAEQQRDSVVAPAMRSPEAMRKAQTKRTRAGSPVFSFQSILGELQTIVKNRLLLGDRVLDVITTPTPIQRNILELLEVAL